MYIRNHDFHYLTSPSSTSQNNYIKHGLADGEVALGLLFAISLLGHIPDSTPLSPLTGTRISGDMLDMLQWNRTGRRPFEPSRVG
jgi:hypothetical protein